MITETLRTMLVDILADEDVDISMSEAEAEGYPYVTYEMTVNPLRDKDGVYGFLGDTYIRVVSDVADDADELSDTVISTLEGVASGYSSRLVAVDKDCISGVWIIELHYQLKQYGSTGI